MKRNKELATTLHSRIVRTRIDACQVHTTDTLDTPCKRAKGQSEFQCAHIIPRRYTEIRTDLTNAWSLCARHHLVIDANPDLWARLLMNTHGLEGGMHHVRALREKIKAGTKVDGQKVTHLKFWRHELRRLLWIASVDGVSLDGIPKTVLLEHDLASFENNPTEEAIDQLKAAA